MQRRRYHCVRCWFIYYEPWGGYVKCNRQSFKQHRPTFRLYQSQLMWVPVQRAGYRSRRVRLAGTRLAELRRSPNPTLPPGRQKVRAVPYSVLVCLKVTSNISFDLHDRRFQVFDSHVLLLSAFLRRVCYIIKHLRLFCIYVTLYSVFYYGR